MSTFLDSDDVCNLGSLSCSKVVTEKLYGSRHGWVTSNCNDDMFQLDKDDFVAVNEELSSVLIPNDLDKIFNPMCEPSDDWMCEFDGSPKPEKTGLKPDSEQSRNIPDSCVSASGKGDNFSFPGGTSLYEDDDELIESKIKAFLDAEALKLKKLQTPLYEEFYNSLNSACSPGFVERVNDETSPNYLKLPPTSRSPSRVPVGSPPVAVDAVSVGIPGSNGRCASSVGNTTDQTSQENSSPQNKDLPGLLVGSQLESYSPGMIFSKGQEVEGRA